MYFYAQTFFANPEIDNFVDTLQEPIVQKPPARPLEEEAVKKADGRKLKVKKTKAEFTLPKATFSQTSSRFQRRISPDFVPLFGGPETEENLTPSSKPIVKSLPKFRQNSQKVKVSKLPRNPRFPRIQPRGEGYRTRYVRQPTNQIPLTRRFKSRPKPGGKYYVVKRKRRPNSSITNRRNEDNELVYEEAKSTVNYQTDKTFHHEGILANGERHGEYGYIDPIGVRRVVSYSTTQNDGIAKAKENDFYGPNTYFEAN